MSLSIFLLWLVSIPPLAYSVPAPRGWLISAGSSAEVKVGSLKYIPDQGFISVGNKSAIKTPNVFPPLATLRYFPDASARKYCYVVPVIKGGKYLVRTSYFYGGFDGGDEPPVFDQIIQGTKWSIVDTTEDYAKGLTSYYEIVLISMTKTMSVCLARNKNTTSSPFISMLEVENLDDSLYNATDFSKYALSTVARNYFGNTDAGMISFPDDEFNRLWLPFMDKNPVVKSNSNITSSQFWNLPPWNAFTTALTTSRGKTLTVQWPPVPLGSCKYYIALYFQDNRTPGPNTWRAFNVSVNGRVFYSNLNVTTNGVMIYAAGWPLSGSTNITLTPGNDMPVGPVINAGEIFQLLLVGERTLTRDVMTMEDLSRHLDSPPSDWSGDPCLPRENSWTGVTCSRSKFARVVTLNLTNMGLSGSLPPSIANLTALTYLLLGGNKLSGQVPNMSSLKELRILHLNNNQFTGPIPQSLGKPGKLRELYLKNNNFTGGIPDSLQKNTNITLVY